MAEASAETPSRRPPTGAVVTLALFGSGFAALVYEVVWLRELTLTLGRTTFSISIILASFMGGMALGNLIFGRIADRLRRPLVGFGLLEIAIGLCGLLLLAVFAGLGPLYRWLVIVTGMSFDGVAALCLKPVIAFVVLTVQTVFMGGTLPVIARHLVRGRGEIGTGVGRIYAANTGGAMLGAFAAGFVILPLLGATAAVLVVVSINIFVGVGAVFLGWRQALSVPEPTPDSIAGESATPVAHLPAEFLVVAYFLVGASALAYEVIWTRQLVFLLGNGSYAFALMLTTFLFGLSIGSYAYARRLHEYADQFRLFAIMQLGIGAAGTCGLLIFYRLPSLQAVLRGWLGAGDWLGILGVKGLLALILMFLPTFLFGATFPLVNRLYIGRVDRLGRGLARLTAANGLGGIVGSLAVGFLLVPSVGVNASVVVIAAGSVALGAFCLASSKPVDIRWGRSLSIAGGAALALGLLAVPLVAGSPSALVAGSTLKRRQILYTEEGVDATVSVLTDRKGSRMLDINGAVTAADTFTDVVVHKMLAHRAMMVHPSPREVLIVGFGLGITANSAVKYAEVERVDIVELIAGERRTAAYFQHYNEGILDNPRAHMIIGDGRDYIGTTRRRYDIISFNAVHPRLGAGLYSRDFYDLCRARLTDGGLVAGWLPTNWMSPVEFRSTLRTFIEVFPESVLWYINPAHLVIVGGQGAARIDYDLVRRRLEPGPIRDDLRGIYAHQPLSYVSAFLMGPAALAKYAADAPVNTDDLSIVEYARSTDMQIHDGIVESLMAARGRVFDVLVTADADRDALELQLAPYHAALPDFAIAELLNWKYDQRDLARARIERALALSPNDPYTRYIAIGYGVPPPDDPTFLIAQPRPAPGEPGDFVDPAAATDPSVDATIQFDAAMQQMRAGDVPDAIGSFEYAVGLQPDYVAAYNNLGMLYASIGQHDLALDNLAHSIALAPRGWLPHFHAGNIHATRGDMDAAILAFNAAIARNPYYVDALRSLARLMDRRGEADRAVALRARAAEVTGGSLRR